MLSLDMALGLQREDPATGASPGSKPARRSAPFASRSLLRDLGEGGAHSFAFPQNGRYVFSTLCALFCSLFCTPKIAMSLFSIHCALFGKNMGGRSINFITTPEPHSALTKPARHSLGGGGSPNTIRMNTCAKSHFNPFVMNTYKNTRLKVVWNEHLQKKGGVGGCKSAQVDFAGSLSYVLPKACRMRILSVSLGGSQ